MCERTVGNVEEDYFSPFPAEEKMYIRLPIVQ